MTRHRDFESAAHRAEPVTFTLDGEQYECITALNAEALEAMSDMATKITDETVGLHERLQITTSFLDIVLLEESQARLAARMADRARPITILDVVGIIRWLIEEVYQTRPTAPPSPSAPGELSTGGTSTSGAGSEDSATP